MPWPGIHGLTCNMTGAVACTTGSASAAICLDGANNSITDVTITKQSASSMDGILVGSSVGGAGAQSNVLVNVTGSSLADVIHISNATNSASKCPNVSGTPYNVCDLTLLGVTKSSSSVTIQDDITNTGSTITDATVGMYVLGEQVFSGDTTRITTSPKVPTWARGYERAHRDMLNWYWHVI